MKDNFAFVISFSFRRFWEEKKSSLNLCLFCLEWQSTGNMSVARHVHTASILSNGKVLVTGGWTGSVSLNSAELYDPSTGNWTTTGTMSVARHVHTASLLSNKTILVTGGCCSRNSAELY
ncbi:unnamed protein product [Adineta ricciae]|uniref:Uncharacterized protein n=1 Tax=Adineta ricciae TaxID=249248 RepID=A0A816GVI8_ADIRI|nr:unnamed protein product [Adineta ricciae]